MLKVFQNQKNAWIYKFHILCLSIIFGILPSSNLRNAISENVLKDTKLLDDSSFNVQQVYYLLLFNFRPIINHIKQMLKDSKLFKDDNTEKIYQKIQKIIKKKQQIDFFHKAFLRPLEISLKYPEKEQKYSKLPSGLKQIIKEDISLNKYKEASFQSFSRIKGAEKDYEYIKCNNYDNMISLLKPGEGEKGLKVAICITMYSEDRTSLNRTLKGIGKNINQFTQKGISADKIGIFVFIDGIETIHHSIVDYVSELQKQSGILLEDETQLLTSLQLFKSLDDYELSKINEPYEPKEDDNYINLNQFIFDEADYKDRKDKRFSNRKKEYEDVKKLIKEIQILQKSRTITFEDLNETCKDYFYLVAKKQHQRLYAEDDDEVKHYNNQFFAREFGQNISISRPLIKKALKLAKIDCIKYLQFRENLALLNCFHLKIRVKKIKQNEGERRILIQDEGQDEQDELNKKQENIQKIKMNLFFITKYKNRGKLSSHNWFFNGVCKQLRPQYSIILDAGLIPDKMAIYKMVSYMEQNQKTGGVCGYMALRVQGLQKDDEFKNHEIGCFSETFHSIFDIQKAQRMEYHFAHLIDKPFQSLFNFIHVLPGAFSGYKMKALQPENQEESELLREYFKSINEITYSRFVTKTDYNPCKVILRVLMPDSLYFCCFEKGQNSEEQLLENENVYLAEDRTLCLGIHENGFDLQYLPDAYSTIDPMKTLHGMMGQRKRWINGSYFGFEKVKRNFKCCRNTSSCLIYFQMLFLHLLNILSFISPTIFLYTIQISMILFQEQVLLPNFENIGETWIQTFTFTIQFIYIMLLLSLAFYSLHMTSKNKYFIPFIYFSSALLGIMAFIVFGILVVQLPLLYLDSDDELPQSLFFMIIAALGVYVLSILAYMSCFCRCTSMIEIICSSFSFVFYAPTYMVIFNIYALSRIDDISWGTKGFDEEKVNESEVEKRSSWKRIKTIHIAKFILWNCIMTTVFISLVDTQENRFFVSYAVVITLLFTLFVKFFCGIIYFIRYKCKKSRYDGQEIKREGFTEDKTDKYFNGMKPFFYDNLKDKFIKIRNDWIKEHGNFTEIVMIQGTSIRNISYKKAKMQNFTSRLKKPKSEFQSSIPDINQVSNLQQSENIETNSIRRSDPLQFKKIPSTIRSDSKKFPKKNKIEQAKNRKGLFVEKNESGRELNPIEEMENEESLASPERKILQSKVEVVLQIQNDS